MNIFEKRFFKIENARASKKSRKLEGYAALFDIWSQNLGGFREVIRQGAFQKSLDAGNDIRAFVDHDTGRVVGRRSSGTLKIEEDSKGLKFEVDLPDTQEGRDLLELVRRGDVNQMSFGFNVTEDKWNYRGRGEVDERELIEIELFEISFVAMPAYEEAHVWEKNSRGKTGMSTALYREIYGIK